MTGEDWVSRYNRKKKEQEEKERKEREEREILDARAKKARRDYPRYDSEFMHWHQDRYQCHICGKPSMGPAYYGCLSELLLLDKPTGLGKCRNCGKLACSEHLLHEFFFEDGLKTGTCRTCDFKNRKAFDAFGHPRP